MKSAQIGLLIAQSGSAGLWGPSAEACGRLAVDEINCMSGILKRPVELVVIDAGSTAGSAAAAASRAIRNGQVQGIVGMLASYAREPVARATCGKVPFIYTPQFEGFACQHSVMTIGETADELIRPGIDYLMHKTGARRFYLCGADYIWPRSSLRTARSIIRQAGGIVTGEIYVSVGVPDYDEILEGIKATKSDAVLVYFLGSDAITFNRAFYEAGLSSRVLRFGSAIDETIVYGLSEEETENIFVTSAYYASIRSHNNGAFLERYHTAYGENPPPANAFGQSCYEGIYSMAALVEEAGSFDVRLLPQYYDRTAQQRTARGRNTTPVVGSRHPIYVARIDGYDFRILNAE